MPNHITPFFLFLFFSTMGSIVAPHTTLASQPKQDAKIILKNGDTLIGKILKADATHITLQTPFGTLKLHKNTVQKIIHKRKTSTTQPLISRDLLTITHPLTLTNPSLLPDLKENKPKVTLFKAGLVLFSASYGLTSLIGMIPALDSANSSSISRNRNQIGVLFIPLVGPFIASTQPSYSSFTSITYAPLMLIAVGQITGLTLAIVGMGLQYTKNRPTPKLSRLPQQPHFRKTKISLYNL